MYAESLHGNGASLDSFAGLVYCNKIEINRPGGVYTLQCTVSSGHKRFNFLVYQTITTPDSQILNQYGPEVGRRHKITLYRQTLLEETLQGGMKIDGRQFYVNGDLAHILGPWPQLGYTRAF